MLGEPGFTLTVPAGLQVREAAPHLFLANFGTAQDAPSIAIASIPPVDFIDRLTRIPAYTASAPIDVAIAGVTARAVDFERAPGVSPNQVLVVVSAGGHGFVLRPGFKARVIELDVAGRTVLVFFDAKPEAFAAQEQIVLPILASLAIV